MALLRVLAALLGAAALAFGAADPGLGCSEPTRLAEREPPPASAPAAPGASTQEAMPTAPPPEPSVSPVAPPGATASSAGTATASEASPGKRRYVVAAMGDSLTDAHSHGGKYLELLRERCPHSRFDNYGVGGEMVNQMRRRFARDVLGEPPVADDPKPAYTHLIVLGGINDICSDESALRSNRKIEADLSEMYRAARGRGIHVVALTMPPWGGFKRYYNARRGGSTREVNDWIRRQEREHAVDAVLDIYPLLSCGHASMLCPRYAWPDQVHWNAEGHRIVGEALYQALFADCE